MSNPNYECDEYGYAEWDPHPPESPCAKMPIEEVLAKLYDLSNIGYKSNLQKSEDKNLLKRHMDLTGQQRPRFML